MGSSHGEEVGLGQIGDIFLGFGWTCWFMFQMLTPIILINVDKILYLTIKHVKYKQITKIACSHNNYNTVNNDPLQQESVPRALHQIVPSTV